MPCLSGNCCAGCAGASTTCIVVGKLRQKLGDDPAAPRWLKTEPGVGYRFLA